MGQMIVDKVAQLLIAQGIRAEHAFPTERITRITEPVAAVSLEKADLDDRTAVVLVEILAPQESGGYLCQTKALEACAVLETAGAACSQGGCDFLSKGHVFRVPVRAVFQGIARSDDLEAVPKFTIKTGSLTLKYACGFTAKQALTDDDASLQSAAWEFTVEEFFPWGTMDTLVAEEPFKLQLKCMDNVEQYENAQWISRKRTVEEKGIRQFRTGIATYRSITSG